jgi:hypothetical protein
MKESALYAELLARMQTATDEELLADLTRFVDSFGDHDDDCPGFGAVGRDAELDACACGFARRYDLLAELRDRLARPRSARDQPG